MSASISERWRCLQPFRLTWLLVLVAVLLFRAAPAPADVTGIAPDFALPDSRGQTVSLENFAGEVVLINFWASWCAPCRQEMPLLEAIYQRYASLGFNLLGINVEEDSSLADRFLQTTPVSFPILYDRENSISKLYDVIAMPTTILVDRQGQMRFIHHGYEPGYEKDYQDQVRALIRE